MKYITQSMPSTTWVAFNRSRIALNLPCNFYFDANYIDLSAQMPPICDAALRLDHLQMAWRIRRGGIFQRLHCGIDAARAMRHAGRRQTHLHARQRAQQRQFVAFAEMADAEDL